MSVRRLADDSVQPRNFAFDEANSAWADAVVRKYPEGRQQSAVIPLLMRAQDQEGWVTKAAVEHIADRLAMPLIRVLEVATFYTQFMLQPVGTKAHIQVCGTTPCMLRGAEDLKSVCRKKISSEPFHRNESGTLSWEEVECQGACVNAPMVMIFKDAYEDLTPERLEEIIDAFEAGRGGQVETGPQNGRHQSVPSGGLTSLTEDYDDLISRQKSEGAHGPANGAGPQGSGAGRAISTPPSEAGLPDSQSAYTDPSIGAAGKAANGNAEQNVEDSESDDLVSEAGSSGAGQEGGARQGDTGEAERDAAETGAATGDADDVRAEGSGGTFIDREAASRAAVVPDAKVVGDESGDIRKAGDGAPSPDLANRQGQRLEGERSATSDEREGPVIDDVFPTEADAAGASADQLGEGEKPGNLRDEPDGGTRDDLKTIKGIGPVIEAKLNELGVYHFAQIAAWGREELIWIDNYLKFRGRALRDDWIGQAKERSDYGADIGPSEES